MSAVFGYWSRSGNRKPLPVLKKMASSLSHKGKETAGLKAFPEIGLGNRLFLSTPESYFETLPLETSDGLILTYDGRIDNREDLIEMIGIDTCCDHNRPITDADIIIHAFRKWGKDSFGKLIGDFAIVIWDQKDKRLHCVVDPMGYRPIFYSVLDKGDFIFASEIKALLASKLFHPKPNELFVAQYLLATPLKNDHTGYSNIKKISPGHYLCVTEENLQNVSFYSFNNVKSVYFKRNNEYADAFKSLFVKAVTSRLRCNKDVGIALSGGLDSSSICSVAQAYTNKEIHTFSAIFPNLPDEERKLIDERDYVCLLLKKYPALAKCFIRCDTLSPLQHIDFMLKHIDNLFWGVNLYISLALYRAAKEKGITVFLNGLDGDTVVSHGLELFPDYLFKGKWYKMAKNFKMYCSFCNINALNPINWWKLVLAPIIKPILGKIYTEFYYENLKLLSKDLKTNCQLKQLLRDNLHTFKNSHLYHVEAISSPVFPYVLEIENQLASSVGIELRSPFLDRRLIEFCLGIPVDEKLQQGRSRFVLREAMRGFLPSKIRLRYSKGNLGVNFARNFLEKDVKRLHILKYINHIKPFVNPAHTNNLPQDIAKTTRYGLNNPLQQLQNIIRIFQLEVLGRWLHKLDE